MYTTIPDISCLNTSEINMQNVTETQYMKHVWTHILMRHLSCVFVSGPKFITLFLSDVQKIVADTAFFRLPIDCSIDSRDIRGRILELAEIKNCS